MLKKLSVLLLEIMFLINLCGCNVLNTRVQYVPFVGEFGPNESCSKYFYYRKYIYEENAGIFELVRYDVNAMEEQIIGFAETAKKQRIEDFYGNDEGALYVFLEHKEGYTEYSLIYHDNISNQDQNITCVEENIIIVKTYYGPIISVEDKYYSLEKENGKFSIAETTVPVEKQAQKDSRKIGIKTENGDEVEISKIAEDPHFTYKVGDKSGNIDALEKENSAIAELSDNYTVEDGKVIGIVQNTNLKYKYYCGYDDAIKPGQLKGAVLYEFDLETCESRVLYEVKGNKKQIIGYKDGYVYIYEEGKVINHLLETGKEELIYEIKDMPEGRLSFNWIGNTLVVFNDTYWEVIGCVKVEN